MNKRPPSNNNRDLLRYAGLGTQILVALVIAVFAGLRIDRWLHSLPLFSCVLPLLVLAGMFYKLFRETGTKKKNEPK